MPEQEWSRAKQLTVIAVLAIAAWIIALIAIFYVWSRLYG